MVAATGRTNWAGAQQPEWQTHLVVQKGLALQNQTHLVLVQTGLLGQLLLERADEVLLLDRDVLCAIPPTWRGQRGPRAAA